MTFSDPRLERPLEPAGGYPDNMQDMIPPNERGKDPGRPDLARGMGAGESRPLTDDEKKLADRASPAPERVYAPASERVPKPPVAGHREMVEHPDTRTSERQSTDQGSPTATAEPTFTRVTRPSTVPMPDAHASGTEWSQTMHPARRRMMFMGMGFSWLTAICCGAGMWMFMRWRRERNRPINRLRRQARHAMETASELRGRMPSPQYAARPAMGLSTALLSVAVLLWQQSQMRSRRTQAAARRAKAHLPTDANEWYRRLAELKGRWSPGRLDLERFSLTRR